MVWTLSFHLLHHHFPPQLFLNHFNGLNFSLPLLLFRPADFSIPILGYGNDPQEGVWSCVWLWCFGLCWGMMTLTCILLAFFLRIWQKVWWHLPKQFPNHLWLAVDSSKHRSRALFLWVLCLSVKANAVLPSQSSSLNPSWIALVKYLGYLSLLRPHWWIPLLFVRP